MYTNQQDLGFYMESQLAQNELTFTEPDALSRFSWLMSRRFGLEGRREQRFPVNDSGMLHCVRPLRAKNTPVRILDVSKSGMKISISKRLQRGAQVQVLLRDGFVVGEVRYCVGSGGVFHAGILVQTAVRQGQVHV